MLQDKLHGLTKEQRLQAATTLAGTDGMRALLALYDAGPKKIKDFENGLKKQGTAAKVAAQQNEGAEGAVRKLKAAWEQAQIIVGEQLLPEIAEGAGRSPTS
jgi:TP901 family phage tail tape measure protein